MGSVGNEKQRRLAPSGVTGAVDFRRVARACRERGTGAAEVRIGERRPQSVHVDRVRPEDLGEPAHVPETLQGRAHVRFVGMAADVHEEVVLPPSSGGSRETAQS